MEEKSFLGLLSFHKHFQTHSVSTLIILKLYIQCSSVAQSCLTLPPHGLQHIRLLWPSPTPRASSNSCPSSCWCHPTISSSAVPFSSCLQSFPASESSPTSQFFTSGGQSIGSFSFSISPSNKYPGLISFDGLVGSPWSPRDSQESSPTPQFKRINSSAIAFFIVQLSHPYRSSLHLKKPLSLFIHNKQFLNCSFYH